jgi:hypothetical protein
MTLELATIPADLLESTPDRDRDHASEPANDPAGEQETEPTPLLTETAPPPHSPQEIAVLSQKTHEIQEIQETHETQEVRKTVAVYPQDHFIHALYGGFLGLPDLPGALLRANLWDSFLDAYTNPEFRHHFAHIVFPTA